MRLLITKHKKVDRVAFSPDGTHLFASGQNSESDGAEGTGIDVFDLVGGPEAVSHLLAHRYVDWFATLPDGRLIVTYFARFGGLSSFRPLLILDWRDEREQVPLITTDWPVSSPLALSSDGHRLLVRLNGPDTRQNREGQYTLELALGCWVLPENDQPRLDWTTSLGWDREMARAAFGPDGRSAWSAEWVPAPTPPLWWIEFVPRDAVTGAATGEPIAYPSERLSDLAFSPTGGFVVAHDKQRLFVYDLAKLDSKPERIGIPAEQDSLGGFAFHPSGKWLAAAGLDGAVTLWDTCTWQVARSWSWGIEQARSVCFSHDGTLAAAGTGDGRVVVWDLDV